MIIIDTMAGPIIQYTAETKAQIISALRQDNLVAIPTETVYGLAADACNDQAIVKIYATKDRPQFNPLITHVANLQQAQRYAVFNELALKLAAEFWPGPLTMVLPQTIECKISKLVTAGLETIAIRVPNHPITLDLLNESDLPLAAPSANPSGRLSPTRADHVAAGFKDMDQPVYIVDGGETSLGLESTIIAVYQNDIDILRYGHITRTELEKFTKINKEQIINDKPMSPGQLLRHYSPQNQVRLNVDSVDPDELLLAFGKPLAGAFKTLNLSKSGNLVEAAANLFKMLHELDEISDRVIAVMTVPNEGLGIAINDRLSRSQQ